MIMCQKIIDIHHEEFLIKPFLYEKFMEIIDKFDLKEFKFKWDLVELERIDLVYHIDKHRANDGMYFYFGIQYTFEELQKHFIENLRKLVIEVVPTNLPTRR